MNDKKREKKPTCQVKKRNEKKRKKNPTSTVNTFMYRKQL